jgi:hypothetical protein
MFLQCLISDINLPCISLILQKPVRRKFKRARVLVSEPYEQYDADIADLSSLAGENDKYRYILVVIDIFSRYLWLEPLRTKTKSFLKRKKVPKLYFHFWPPKKCPPFFFLIHTW